MKMKYAIYATLVGVILLLLTSCGGADSATHDQLDGTSWELEAYHKSKPIPGTTITATFEKGQIRGSAGCNSYFGSYQISGNKITMVEIAITEMACLGPEGIMEQEMLIMEFFRDAQSFRFIDGQLQIFRSDGEALTFAPQE